MDWHIDHFSDALGDSASIDRIASGKQHDVLITTETRDGCLALHHLTNTIPAYSQQMISRLMPCDAVDRLEAVQVDQQDRKRRPITLRHIDAVIDAGFNLRSVKQTCQSIKRKRHLRLTLGDLQRETGVTQRGQVFNPTDQTTGSGWVKRPRKVNSQPFASRSILTEKLSVKGAGCSIFKSTLLGQRVKQKLSRTYFKVLKPEHMFS